MCRFIQEYHKKGLVIFRSMGVDLRKRQVGILIVISKGRHDKTY
jgi:hypothetical protein